ncbi:hypothetical protein MTR67_003317 [Solanum verrucosum]|uniref:Uncharacterized protein n=1 Tax=Solanum verrucosum TaxID=315347 RepID=A0AAF0PSL9_SOLVR|nr:hypothetical protein MTR67_003317 [Solanum verrucosum]
MFPRAIFLFMMGRSRRRDL